MISILYFLGFGVAIVALAVAKGKMYNDVH